MQTIYPAVRLAVVGPGPCTGWVLLVFEPPGFFRPMLTINCQTSGQPDGAEKILQRVGHPQGAPPAWAASPPPARKLSCSPLDARQRQEA